MRSGTLNAVTMVDSTLSSLGIHVEKLEVIVEINRACAKVTPKEGSVSCEDSGYVNPPLSAKRESDTGEPLVEMRDHCFRSLIANEL
jgi:hypothetical protein